MKHKINSDDLYFIKIYEGSNTLYMCQSDDPKQAVWQDRPEKLMFGSFRTMTELGSNLEGNLPFKLCKNGLDGIEMKSGDFVYPGVIDNTPPRYPFILDLMSPTQISDLINFIDVLPEQIQKIIAWESTTISGEYEGYTDIIGKNKQVHQFISHYRSMLEAMRGRRVRNDKNGAWIMIDGKNEWEYWFNPAERSKVIHLTELIEKCRNWYLTLKFDEELKNLFLTTIDHENT